MIKSKLLCAFTHKQGIDLVLENIDNTFTNVDKIFVFYNTDNVNDYYVTFNTVISNITYRNYISIHRKKETNTLYTVNALNTLIKKLNNGILDTNYLVDWSIFRNTLLLLKNNELNRIPLTLDGTYKK